MKLVNKPVYYQKWDDAQKKIVLSDTPCDDYTSVSSDNVRWGSSDETTWYVADKSITYDRLVDIYGTVNLILCDDVTIKGEVDTSKVGTYEIQYIAFDSLSNKTVITVFTEAFGIYAKHLPTFLKYMSFPVFGQFAGLALSLILPLWLAPVIVAVIGDEKLAFAITMLLSLPGIILFTKAFWEYLVAYVSVCSMAENTVKSGRIYDINAHKKVATMSKRVGSFVTLWLLFGVFTIVAILPPMWFFAAIIFVFISLIFQVFTFEKNLSAAE